MSFFDIVRSHPAMIGHIQRSVYETLKVYTSSELVPAPHYYTPHAADVEVAVIGSLDIRERDNTSRLALGFSREVFLHVYENMFRESLTRISPDAADLAGELVNIIFQSIDPELRKLGYVFEAALPNVITHSGPHEWVSISAKQSLVLPFSTERGDILFEIFETNG